MTGQIGLRGTRNASFTGIAEGLLVLAAAAEAVLLAGLALILGKVGQGSGVVAAFMRLNAALLRPFDLFFGASPSLGPSAGVRQVLAVVGYGIGFLALIGIVSWFERRRALY